MSSQPQAAASAANTLTKEEYEQTIQAVEAKRQQEVEKMQAIVQQQVEVANEFMNQVKELKAEMEKLKAENGELKEQRGLDIQNAEEKIEKTCQHLMISKMERMSEDHRKDKHMLELQLAKAKDNAEDAVKRELEFQSKAWEQSPRLAQQLWTRPSRT